MCMYVCIYIYIHTDIYMHRRQRGFDGGAAFAQRMRTCVVGAAAGGSGACIRSASVVEGQVHAYVLI